MTIRFNAPLRRRHVQAGKRIRALTFGASYRPQGQALLFNAFTRIPYELAIGRCAAYGNLLGVLRILHLKFRNGNTRVLDLLLSLVQQAVLRLHLLDLKRCGWRACLTVRLHALKVACGGFRKGAIDAGMLLNDFVLIQQAHIALQRLVLRLWT